MRKLRWGVAGVWQPGSVTDAGHAPPAQPRATVHQVPDPHLPPSALIPDGSAVRQSPSMRRLVSRDGDPEFAPR
ncbi:MAG: hypothetical protein ACRDRS_09985 [Pseudonocardiaceae bacterium]